MTDRQANLVNELMAFLEESNVGRRGTATRRALLDEVRARIERFFDGDVHRTSPRVEPDAEPEVEPGPDCRVHKVTPRIPSGLPSGAVEMTQGESMKIDARAGNTPEMSDG